MVDPRDNGGVHALQQDFHHVGRVSRRSRSAVPGEFFHTLNVLYRAHRLCATVLHLVSCNNPLTRLDASNGPGRSAAGSQSYDTLTVLFRARVILSAPKSCNATSIASHTSCARTRSARITRLLRTTVRVVLWAFANLNWIWTTSGASRGGEVLQATGAMAEAGESLCFACVVCVLFVALCHLRLLRIGACLILCGTHIIFQNFMVLD